jgi:hypothetical protein
MIAAIVLAYHLTLLTRNRCDFARIPGLKMALVRYPNPERRGLEVQIPNFKLQF